MHHDMVSSGKKEMIMARNVEIKAVAENVGELSAAARRMSSEPPTTVEQTDVFFRTEAGRLKLSILSPGYGELIFYDRPDQAGPKTNTYTISITNQPSALRAVLSAAYGEDVIVRKVRKLYLAGRTRIHVDAVEDLGDFVELEVVLEDAENPDDGIAEAHALMAELGIRRSNLVEGACADLLKARESLP